MSIPDRKMCFRCDIEKPKDAFYQRRNGKSLSPYCKQCQIDQALERQQNVKKQCAEYKGGKCQKCGYNKCIAALEFHHLDPSKKGRDISDFKATKFGDKHKEELDKCILVCSNCHRELHYNINSKKPRNIRINPPTRENVIRNYCLCGIEISRHSKICKSCRETKKIKAVPPKKESEKFINSYCKICVDCGSYITRISTRCKSCATFKLSRTKISWPDMSILMKMLQESNYSALAKKLGVSDNAIRKHIKHRIGRVGLEPTT